jgi:hypothetical protein
MARRTTTAAGRPTHAHGRGCPGKGAALTDRQVEESYRWHREEFEEQLVRSIASGRPRGQRPLWWWRHTDAAAPYRDDAGRFERPDEYTVSATVPEAWVRASIQRRRIVALGRLRFLAESGLLSDAEVERILNAGDTAAAMRKGSGLPTMYEHQARVVREGLARRGTR